MFTAPAPGTGFKNLVVEMFERGRRHLTFNASNDNILEARKLHR